MTDRHRGPVSLYPRGLHPPGSLHGLSATTGAARERSPRVWQGIDLPSRRPGRSKSMAHRRVACFLYKPVVFRVHGSFRWGKWWWDMVVFCWKCGSPGEDRARKALCKKTHCKVTVLQQLHAVEGSEGSCFSLMQAAGTLGMVLGRNLESWQDELWSLEVAGEGRLREDRFSGVMRHLLGSMPLTS